MELHSCFQYSNQNVQERIQWFYYRGAPHFPGKSSFFQGGGGGVQILISIEPQISCDFRRGGPNPLSPPMDPHINTEAVIRIETGV